MIATDHIYFKAQIGILDKKKCSLVLFTDKARVGDWINNNGSDW